MIAASALAIAVHALLHDRPFAVIGHEEPVQVQVEPVLDDGAIHLCHQPAGAGQAIAVETDPFAKAAQFVRRFPRMLAAAAADVDAELVGQGPQPALERADHARRDAGGVPVHAHDGTEGLEPKRVGQAAQELVAAVMVRDRLRDDSAQ